MQMLPSLRTLTRFTRKTVPSLLFAGLNASLAHAGTTNAWTGASLTDSNWSTGGNWSSLAAPAASDAVVFLDSGAAVSAGVPDNFIDPSFAGTISSLQYANETGFHTTQLAEGVTLNITGSGSLTVGTLEDVPAGITVQATIQGSGTVNLDNPAGNLVIQQSASGTGSPRAILDLSGLNIFVANVNRIGIGTTSLPLSTAANQRLTGTLFLAQTNVIRTAYIAPPGAYLASGADNSIEIGENTSNPAGMNFLYLGAANIFNVDSIAVGREKSSPSYSAWMGFNPALTNVQPVAVFRGAAGGTNRITWWGIGDMNTTGSSAQSSVGTCDFSIGSVDALVDVMSLGRDCNASHTASSANAGTLTFSAGIVDVNTLILGNQSLGLVSNTPPNIGVLNVSGTNATLVVNGDLILGYTTQDSIAATNTYGTLTVNGGVVRANTITVGQRSTNNTISVNGGFLIVSNTIASALKPLDALGLADATLGMNVTGATAVAVSKLSTSGATNVLALRVAAFTSFPTQLTLIQYSGVIGGAGFNFGLGTNTLGDSYPGAYLSNNVANHSVDLVLPNGPLPVITSRPKDRVASAGTAVSFTVDVSSSSATPLTYQWFRDATSISDGNTGNGSTRSGTTTATLTIDNAQIADSGSYSVMIINAYGSATSTPANLTITTGPVPPYLTGPTNLAVIQGNNATFSASVSGVPVPWLQWQKNGTDIPGANAASLTITNAQYPDDQAVYSIIASNSVGMATNSAALTVIAPPVITAQPQSLTVVYGQSAEFSVTASSQLPLAYQWWKDSSAIAGATNSTLDFSSVTVANAGTYFATVANAAGTVASSNATLTVNPGITSTLSGAQDYIVDPNCPYAYATVQLAVDAVSGQSATNRANIYIAPGVYTEQVTIAKPYVSLIGLGDSPTNVMITFDGVQFWFATMIVSNNATGFMARNLTFDNSFPEYDAIQTLAVESDADQVVFDHCYFLSYQDTLLMQRKGRQYLYNCLIAGDTDFNYGDATAVYDHCTIVSTDGGYITAVNTARTTAIGFVFFDCTLLPGSSRHATDKQTSAANNSVYLGRPWQWTSTNTIMSSATFIRTKMGPQIATAGWDPWNGSGDPNFPNGDPFPDAVSRYSEFGSMDLNGVPLTLDANGVPVGRVSWADPMNASQAANYTLANIFGGASTIALWNTPGSQPEGTGQTYVDTRAPWDPLAQLAVLPVPAKYPVLNNPARADDRNIQLTFSGRTCQDYRLWAATNLASGDVTNSWTLVGSGTFGKTNVVFKDTQATNFPSRFYILTSP